MRDIARLNSQKKTKTGLIVDESTQPLFILAKFFFYVSAHTVVYFTFSCTRFFMRIDLVNLQFVVRIPRLHTGVTQRGCRKFHSILASARLCH